MTTLQHCTGSIFFFFSHKFSPISNTSRCSVFHVNGRQGVIRSLHVLMCDVCWSFSGKILLLKVVLTTLVGQKLLLDITSVM